MELALELKNVTKRYDGFTLDAVSFSLPRGCIMGLIGENGAGKSTTIRLILDLIGKDEGTITLLGEDSRDASKALREKIGVVMDESCFPENFTLRDVDSVMKRVYHSWVSEEFFAMAHRFSLPDKKIVKDYSHGMKMKLAIAAALSHRAELLILDEATSGLDPVVREEILDVFLEFIQDESHSILLSSHILSDLQKVCDYITFIHRGKVLFSRGKDELLESYGILKCSPEEFSRIDKFAVAGYRESKFGVEALVLRDKIPSGLVVDRAGIEDIMLYYVKENVQ
ncbi:ABC transporter ATP-binding protein [Papillibacter cinnamivorans]|uniref:ABC-2 type transport system ATP-binding protein n=1 Tax=Papillibacter cinnamivorans DSM 12816 TaxID=1122930 RepID=A0A1W2C9Q4_9FIRM|nr:ABC transporter ATP-binding protein [Papillibacter cinnamivorans]SMC81861.1 ABC-2 type transport system ATP-binding protein [Papillibacter cinnamivorans DSM 12816]